MSAIGSRIREERERLGLSQEAFGEFGGVKKLAQLNYEKGKRSPTGDYFELLRQHNEVDVNYIVTGMRTGPEWDDALAHRYVLVNMATAIGIKLSDLSHVCDLALLQQKKTRLGEEANPSEICEMVYNMVESAVGLKGVDYTLLTDTLVEVESKLNAIGGTLTPEKKSRMVVMLYRSFKEHGRFDMRMVEDAVLLSSSMATSHTKTQL